MGKIFKFPETELQHSGTTTKAKFMFIDVFPEQDGTLTYNGEIQYPNWKNLDPMKLLVEGERGAVDAGIHYITVTPQGSFGWPDNTQTPRQVPYEIKRKPIEKEPSLASILTFNGLSQSPSWNDYDPDVMTLGGVVSGINADTYDATFTPDSNHCWRNGSYDALTKTWSIEKKLFDKVTLAQNSYTYTGENISVLLNNFDANWMTTSGSSEAVNKGIYLTTAALTDKANTAWKDRTTDDLELSWSITALKLPKVTASSKSVQWAGGETSPTWQNFDANYISASGTSSNNLGDHTAIFALKDKDNITWDDDSTDDISIDWTLTKRLLAKPTAPFSTKVFDGNTYSANNLNLTFMNAVGTFSGSDSINVVNKYGGTVSLKDTTRSAWADGSTNDITLSWTITPLYFDFTYTEIEATFDIKDHTVTVPAYDSRYIYPCGLNGSAMPATTQRSAGQWNYYFQSRYPRNVIVRCNGAEDSFHPVRFAYMYIGKRQISLPQLKPYYTYTGRSIFAQYTKEDDYVAWPDGTRQAKAVGDYTLSFPLYYPDDTYYELAKDNPYNMTWHIVSA